jgi:hypothetical protein
LVPAAEGLTRADLLVRGAVGVAAAYGVSSVAPFVEEAFAKERPADLELLAFVRSLKQAEAALYNKHRKGKLRLSEKTKKVAGEFAGHELRQAQELRKIIKKGGGTPRKKPIYQFPFTNEEGFLAAAETLEETGVASLNAVVPRVTSSVLAAKIAAILQVEARHAAVIRLMRGGQAAPHAFDGVTSTTAARARFGRYAKT